MKEYAQCLLHAYFEFCNILNQLLIFFHLLFRRAQWLGTVTISILLLSRRHKQFKKLLKVTQLVNDRTRMSFSI